MELKQSVQKQIDDVRLSFRVFNGKYLVQIYNVYFGCCNVTFKSFDNGSFLMRFDYRHTNPIPDIRMSSTVDPKLSVIVSLKGAINDKVAKHLICCFISQPFELIFGNLSERFKGTACLIISTEQSKSNYCLSNSFSPVVQK
jgi:hypothetical protein